MKEELPDTTRCLMCRNVKLLFAAGMLAVLVSPMIALGGYWLVKQSVICGIKGVFEKS